MLNGITGLLRLDGNPADEADAAHVEAMAAMIAHRGVGPRRVRRDGPLCLAAGVTVAAGGTLGAVEGTSAPAARMYAEHGLAFAERLRGPFAVALWDGFQRRLVLGRDRAGQRPLFFTRPRPGLLLFASELKALFAHPETPREADWMGALARFVLPTRRLPPTSGFRGIDAVPPGSLVVADARDARVDTRRYWRLRFASDKEAAGDRRSESDVIAGFREVLATAVADAQPDGQPAALFLSGGIDSIAIAALARAPGLEALTVVNRSTIGNGDAGLAHEAAVHLGLRHHPVVFRRDGALTPERWRRIVWMCESPDARAQHYLKSELARRAREARPDLGVLLHGEGSDELYGADPGNWADHSEGGGYEDYLERLREMQRGELHTVETLAMESWFGGRRVLTDEVLARHAGKEVPRHPMQHRLGYCLPALEEVVLWRDDRLGAWHGLEARSPFLDERVLEYVAGIPPHLHASLFWKKRILREALPELPERLRWQRKIPFYAGAEARFTSRMLLDVVTAEGEALVREALGDPDRHPVLAPGFIRGLLDQAQRDPDATGVDELLLFVNLGLLEGMARDAGAQARLRGVDMPRLTTVDRWDEAGLDEALGDRGSELPVDRPLALGPGVELAHPQAGEATWVVVRDQVRYVIDGAETLAWRRLLARVDGVTPLASLLEELGLSLAAIRANLDEALELEVVRLD